MILHTIGDHTAEMYGEDLQCGIKKWTYRMGGKNRNLT